jgi:uncharacterized protein
MDSKELANLLDACRRGNTDDVTQLCQLHPNLINAADAKGFTPLIIAVYNNQPAVINILLQNGADPNKQDLSGNTALMGACFKGYLALAEKLLTAGAAINLRNEQGATALTFAATFGQLAIAKLLLQHGAEVNHPDSRGKTSLDYAVMQKNNEMVALLSSSNT